MNKIALILCFIILTYSNSETFNKIDKGYNSKDIEKGLHFYEEKKDEQEEEVKIITEPSATKNPKNETNKLLQEIVMVLKQQNNEIKELKKTIIIATHDPIFDNLDFVDSEILIKNGQICE